MLIICVFFFSHVHFSSQLFYTFFTRKLFSSRYLIDLPILFYFLHLFPQRWQHSKTIVYNTALLCVISSTTRKPRKNEHKHKRFWSTSSLHLVEKLGMGSPWHHHLRLPVWRTAPRLSLRRPPIPHLLYGPSWKTPPTLMCKPFVSPA